MKAKLQDMELQIKCASALGHLAYKGNHKRHKIGSGQLKTIHFDYDEVSEVTVLLQEAGAISLGTPVPSRARLPTGTPSRYGHSHASYLEICKQSTMRSAELVGA